MTNERKVLIAALVAGVVLQRLVLPPAPAAASALSSVMPV